MGAHRADRQVGRLTTATTFCAEKLNRGARLPHRDNALNLPLFMAHDISNGNEPQMTKLERIRHSAPHVLATAVLRVWPEAQFAANPPVENGFYYDL